MKAIEIEEKKYVLRGNFKLASNPKIIYQKEEIEKEPEKFEEVITALLSIERQNTLVPLEQMQTEEAALKKRFDEAKKASRRR